MEKKRDSLQSLTLRNRFDWQANKMGSLQGRVNSMNKKLPSAAWIIVFIISVALVVWLVRAVLAAFP